MTEMAERGVTEAWLAEAVVTGIGRGHRGHRPGRSHPAVERRGRAHMFGYSAAEAMGQSLDLIIPEKLRDRHWKGYRETMSTGITRYGDSLLSVPASHKDGRRLSIEFSVALLRNDAEEIVGISAIMREVSERREAEGRFARSSPSWRHVRGWADQPRTPATSFDAQYPHRVGVAGHAAPAPGTPRPRCHPDGTPHGHQRLTDFGGHGLGRSGGCQHGGLDPPGERHPRPHGIVVREDQQR